eukprot:scaffold48956_cov32-Tisochrysis_lutea.AAC.1
MHSRVVFAQPLVRREGLCRPEVEGTSPAPKRASPASWHHASPRLGEGLRQSKLGLLPTT